MLELLNIKFEGITRPMVALRCPCCGTIFAVEQDLYDAKYDLSQDPAIDGRDGIIACPCSCAYGSISWPCPVRDRRDALESKRIMARNRRTLRKTA